MGNLFLKEKENWWIWLFWSLIGAICSFYVSGFSNKVHFLFIPAVCLLSSLTIWMSYSKRFGFIRAFKVLLFVGCCTFLPLLYTQNYTLDEVTRLFVDSACVLLSLTLFCIIGALFARRPRQYY